MDSNSKVYINKDMQQLYKIRGSVDQRLEKIHNLIKAQTNHVMTQGVGLDPTIIDASISKIFEMQNALESINHELQYIRHLQMEAAEQQRQMEATQIQVPEGAVLIPVRRMRDPDQYDELMADEVLQPPLVRRRTSSSSIDVASLPLSMIFSDHE